jgi:hypothetical protein
VAFGIIQKNMAIELSKIGLERYVVDTRGYGIMYNAIRGTLRKISYLHPDDDDTLSSYPADKQGLINDLDEQLVFLQSKVNNGQEIEKHTEFRAQIERILEIIKMLNDFNVG